MKIKCITNKVSSLPQVIKENYSISYENFFVSEGEEYTVYAISIHLGYVWYYLGVKYLDYPDFFPATLFEVTDNRLSRYWVIGVYEINGYLLPKLAFPKWIDQMDFYSNLVDGEDMEVNIFKKYKNLMELEFPNPLVTESAQIGDDQWLMCPDCIDAWECNNSLDALVRCPMCQKLFNNPRYKNKWPHVD